MTINASPLEMLNGPIEDVTLRLLRSAAYGDSALLHELVEIGLALGELVHDAGRWQWGRTSRSAGARLTTLIEGHAPRLTDVQLDALEELTRELNHPHAAVTKVRRNAAQGIHLTPREQLVLSLLCSELTADGIARRLGLSPRTVTKHQENLYRKFGTSNRLATVLLAQRLGLVATPAD